MIPPTGIFRTITQMLINYKLISTHCLAGLGETQLVFNSIFTVNSEWLKGNYHQCYIIAFLFEILEWNLLTLYTEDERKSRN